MQGNVRVSVHADGHPSCYCHVEAYSLAYHRVQDSLLNVVSSEGRTTITTGKRQTRPGSGHSYEILASSHTPYSALRHAPK
jgi:hypothetical protein